MKHVFPMCHWSGAAGVAVKFDGVVDLSRGADLTGNADSGKGIIFFLINRTVLTNQDHIYVVRRGAGFTDFSVIIPNSNQVQIFGVNTDGNIAMRMVSTFSLNTVDIWHVILASWDLSLSSAFTKLFIDDVDVTNLTTFNAGQLINYTGDDHLIGRSATGLSSLQLKACLASLYVNFGESSDLSVEANRRKFYSAGLKPVNMGVNGELPTGNPPDVYMVGDEDAFPINQGTGGLFTLNDGPLVNCATAP